MKQRHVMVIGAGAGGLCAAIAAAETGARVTVLEKRPRPGKKLLATGNGRCNLANLGAPRYFGDAGFAGKALACFPVSKLMETLERWGLPLIHEQERVYPAVRQASAALSLLTERLSALHGELLTDQQVVSLDRAPDGFLARTENGSAFRADACVLATGGLAGGNLGSSPEDYQLARGLGHRVTPLFGALAPIETSPAPPKALSGLRLPAYVRLTDGESFLQAESGEVLFTDYGLSGICVMQLARAVQQALDEGLSPTLTLDFSPMLFKDPLPYGPLPPSLEDGYREILSMLRQRSARLQGQQMLTGLLPDALARRLQGQPLQALARALSRWSLPVRRVRPLAYAQVTAGGADTAQVSPQTMASRCCPGLFLAGEMLNVDGACGGFNLQFAMISGILAGQSAAAKQKGG